MISNHLKLIPVLLLAILMAGCGSSSGGGGGSTTNLPVQVPITRQSAIITGQISLPELNRDNLNLSLGFVTDYAGFIVTASWKESNGTTVTITGNLNPQNGNYNFQNVPFGKEVTIEVKKGKLHFLKILDPISSANPDVSNVRVDSESTAEAILYQELKSRDPMVSIAGLVQFGDSKNEIARQLIEVLKEDVDADSLSILQRPAIVQQVQNTATQLIQNQIPNFLPYAVLNDMPTTSPRGSLDFSFSLYDRESDKADVVFLFAQNGMPERTATQSPESFVFLNQLQTGPNGVRYNLRWDTVSDLGAGSVFSARILLKVYPAGIRGPASESVAQSVMLSIDNRGISFIQSASPGVHRIGSPTSLTLLGTQFQSVQRVSLKYFGEDPFIRERSFPLSFILNSGQEITATIPAFGLFPVPWRPTVEDGAGVESSAQQEILVFEDTPPDISSPNLSPVSGTVDLAQRITFEGFFLSGAFKDGVTMRHISTGESYVVSSEQITLISTGSGRMLYSGFVPANIRAGVYTLFVKNTCTVCGAPRTMPVSYTASEPLANINTVRFLNTVSEGEAFNSTDNILEIRGLYMSSVSEVRISTSLILLNQQFLSQFSLPVLTATTSLVRVLVPQGFSSSQYWLGVLNQAGTSVFPQSFLIREGPIPQTGLSVDFFLDPGLTQQIAGNPPDPFNTAIIYARFTGQRLSSLEKLRLTHVSNPNLLFETSPLSTSFTQAVVQLPGLLPPAGYRFTLINEGGLTEVICPGAGCIAFREFSPLIQSVENIRAQSPFGIHDILASEPSDLQIRGENLAGTTRIQLSAATVPEIVSAGGAALLSACSIGNLLPTTVGPLPFFASFSAVTASVLPSANVTPGCYVLELENTAGSIRTTAPILKVYENRPVLNRIEPAQIATNRINLTNLTLSGTNLLGTRQIHFFHFRENVPSCPPTQNLSNALFSLDRTALLAASSAQVVINPAILQLQNTLPGNYLVRLQNRSHPQSLNPDLSDCNLSLNTLRISEPQLEFHGFLGGIAGLTPSTAVAVTTTEPVLIAGRYLNGLKDVIFKRRFDIPNLPSQIVTPVLTSGFSTASFALPPQMLVGDYDLILENSSGFGAIETGSVTVIETETPTIQLLALDGTSNLNTTDIKYRLYGANMDSLILAQNQISLPISLREVCLRDERSTLSVFESERCIPINLSTLRLRVLPDTSRYIELTLPAGFSGGDYFVQVQNMAGLRAEAPLPLKITVKEPKVVFESVSVVKFPQETDFGFGENDRKLRFEIRGQNLASVDEIRLIREADPLVSVPPIILGTAEIARIFTSAEVTLMSTLPQFLRPGFYSLSMRNNSLEYSDILASPTSRFAQQISIREGAPRLIRSGCLDEVGVCDLAPPVSTNPDCRPGSVNPTDHTSRNVDSTVNLKLSGCNFYTLNRVRVFRDNSLVPEYSFTVPELDQSLAGSSVLTRGQSSLELVLPQYLRYVGFYDVEITNQASSRRFPKKLRSTEQFTATISGLNPTQMINTNDVTINLSGDHLTGTTYVALWSTNSNRDLVTEVLRLNFTQNQNDPLHFLTFSVPKNIPPATYGIRVNNSLGYNSVPRSNILTITEASLSVSTFSTSSLINHTTQTLQIIGEGFWGVNQNPISLIPAQDPVFGPLNPAYDISHSPISIASFRVVSRTLMEIDVPARQLPGYYQISMKNSQNTTFTTVQVLRIREDQPKLFDISPSSQSYAITSMARLTGESFLGIRSGNQNTFVQLVSADNSFSRTLSVTPVSYTTVELQIPQNLAIGEYQIKVQNTEGSVSSGTTTRFTIVEEAPSIALVSVTTLAYNLNFLGGSDSTVDFTGLNLQGIRSIKITTTITAGTFTYEFSVPCPDLIPYISLGQCRINTSGIVYPAVYQISLENSVATTILTQTLNVTIPPSQITNFTADGPLNSENLIELTGAHLRRFEILEMVSTADDSVDNILNSAQGSKYTEFSNSEGYILFKDPPSNQPETFLIRYQTYGDRLAGLAVKELQYFSRTGFVPEITSILDSNSVILPTTTEFVGASTAIFTTSIDSGLPQTLILQGNHFKDIQRVILHKDSKFYTIACTDGFGVNSLNASTQPTVMVEVPKSIFEYPPTGVSFTGGTCVSVNTSSAVNPDVLPLPLKPGVYNFVLLGRDNGEILYSSRISQSSSMYFSEGYPNGLSVNLLTSTSFNNLDINYEVTGTNLAGVDQVRIYRTLAPPFSRVFSVAKDQITSSQRFIGTIPKGAVRGMKNPNFPYLFEVRNSRGVVRNSTPVFQIAEDVPVLSSISPNSNRNNAVLTATVTGLNLLGVGQNVGGTPQNPIRNRLRMIYKEGLDNSEISSEAVEVTASVHNQSLTSFSFQIPAQLRSGEWVLSVENDHFSTASNPRLVTDVIFTVVDSLMQVSQVQPSVSVYDSLPTSLVLIGQSLGGIRTAILDLQNPSTPNQLILSLTSSPDVTAATWGSASFTLPQSPQFLIPGTYSITVINRSVTETLQNLQLNILEKQPFITGLNAATYDNAVTRALDISGIDLFGNPVVTMSLGSQSVTLPLTGVVQTPQLLSGFVIPDTLFPDSWTLSLTNSVGSTQRTLVVTEALPIVSQILPNRIPYGIDSAISLKGDHMLGALTSAGSIVLTDLVRTPLLGILPLDRYEVGAVVPQGVNIGKYEVLVSNRSGRNSTSAFLTVTGSGLGLGSITPTTGPEAGGTRIEVFGSGFTQGTQLAIGGKLALDVLVEPEKLTATVPKALSSLNFSSGSTVVSVQVINPDGEEAQLLNAFTYIREGLNSPRVLSVVPGIRDPNAALPINIPLNSKIAIRFDQSMLASSLSSPLATGPEAYKSLQVLSNRASIGGTLIYDSQNQWFVFDALGNLFVPSQTVEIGLSSLILSSLGNGLVSTDVIQQSSAYFSRDSFIEDWIFTAGLTSDTAALSVSSRSFTTAVSTNFDLVMNKPVNPLTIRDEDAILTETFTGRRIPVQVRVSLDLMRLILDPEELLVPNLQYEIRYKNTVLESLTGRKLSSDYSFLINSESSGPEVLSIRPVNGATEVALNSTLIVNFNQAVDPTSVNTTTIFLEDSLGRRFTGLFRQSDNGRVYTLKLTDFLEPNQNYVATITNRIKSMSGVAGSRQVTSGFMTSASQEIDTSAPVVASLNPAYKATGVLVDRTIQVQFSEPIHPADITTANFKFLLDGQNLPVSLSQSSDLSLVTMTPATNLLFGKTYAIRIEAGLHDLADNTSSVAVDSEFTTTRSFDTTGPILLSSNPSDQQQAVSTQAQITLVFNENLDAATVIPQNFVFLSSSGLAVAYNLVFSVPSTVVLSPSQPLSRNTSYTVSVREGLQDSSANPALPVTIAFRTDVFNDTINPEITLLTVNDFPDCLNGNNRCVSGAPTGISSVVIRTPDSGFSIDIYHIDPGTDGESSGIDLDSVAVTDEKQILNTLNNSNIPPNANLLLQPGAIVERTPERTRLTIPSSWQFQPGLHVLRASVRDASSLGNPSNPADPRATYSFEVASQVAEPQNFPFAGGRSRCFALDFNGDHFRYVPGTRSSALMISSTFEFNGVADMLEEMQYFGLASFNLDRTDSPTPTEIAFNVFPLLQQMILTQTRSFFLQDANGNSLPQNQFPIRFSLNPLEEGCVRLAVGGDNGAEWGGSASREAGLFFDPLTSQFTGIVPKAEENSVFNSRNLSWPVDLSSRSANPAEGKGVFTAHLLRRHANDPGSLANWFSIFRPLSTFAYANVGNGTGFPIGYFPEDANVYLLEPNQVNIQTVPSEFHRTRHATMRTALQVWAKIVSASIVRAVALATGALPDGLPPLGAYGNTTGSAYFNNDQSATHKMQIIRNSVPENNLLRRELDLFSIINDIHLGVFERAYLQNRMWAGN